MQQIRIVTYSDISGNGDANTVRFGLDGNRYEIDLTPQEEMDLREKLARFVNAARPVRPYRPERRPRRGADPQAVRAWAERANVKVSRRGRIPQSVVEQYELAQST